MKLIWKYLWWSIPGALFLTSCGEDTLPSGGDCGRVEMMFSRPVVAGETRAVSGRQPDEKGHYRREESFRVFAQWDNPVFRGWNSVGSVLYMENEPMRWQTKGTYEGWFPDRTIYWPNEGVLTFAAVSPASLVEDAELSYGGERTLADGRRVNGLSVGNFVVKPTPDLQYDLMYSRRTYNQSRHGTSDPVHGGVDLAFRHALSLVRFTVRTNKVAAGTINLTGLEIRSVCQKGSFNEGVVEDAQSPASYDNPLRYWTIDPHYPRTDYKAFAGSQPLVDAPSYVLPLEFILLPQRFALGEGVGGSVIDAPDAEIVVRWTDGGQPHEKGYRLDQLNRAWEVGKSYTYNIVIGANEINFQPSVDDDWAAGNGSQIEVNP